MDINDFKFLKCLGKGGTSDVFLGKSFISFCYYKVSNFSLKRRKLPHFNKKYKSISSSFETQCFQKAK